MSKHNIFMPYTPHTILLDKTIDELVAGLISITSSVSVWERLTAQQKQTSKTQTNLKPHIDSIYSVINKAMKSN